MNSTTDETIECLPLDVNFTLASLWSPFSKIFITVLVPTVSFIGLCMNLAFLFVVYRVREMRTTTNFYLSNLATADSCVLVVGALQYIWSFSQSPIDIGVFNFGTPTSCFLPNFIIYLCFFASIFIVTFVTGERYLAICHVLKFQASKRRTLIFCAISWTISAVFTSFTSSYTVVRHACLSWPSEDVYSSYQTVITFCIHGCKWCPKVLVWADLIQYLLAVPAVVYMSIAMMIQVQRPIVNSETCRSRRTTQTRSHVARMLIINATIFFICLTPYEILNMNLISKYFISSGVLSSSAKNYITWVGRIAMLLNSAVNPLVYSLVNPSYRRAFSQAWFCCCQSMAQKQSDYELMNRSKLNLSTAMTNNLNSSNVTKSYHIQPSPTTPTCHTTA